MKHRLTHANILYNVGTNFDYRDLMKVAEQARLGDQPGQRESEFAIDGDWKEDTEGKPGDMVKDFPANALIVEYAPLTISDFDKFFYALYADALAAEIRKILDKRGRDYDPQKGVVLNEAVDSVATMDRPRRWVLKDFYAAIRPDDADAFGSGILAKHPRFQEFRAAQEAKSVDPIFPYPFYPYHQSGIVIWTFPSLHRLKELLETIDGLAALVSAAMGANREDYEEQARTAKKGQQLPPLGSELVQWFAALRRVLQSHAQFEALLRSTLTSKFNASVKELRAQTRRATSHQRRVILDSKVIPLFTKYKVGVDNISTYTFPN